MADAEALVTNTDIRLLVLDVDGVLTDGTLLMDDEGRQWRGFHIQDGLGIRMWRETGRKAAILTSKQSQTVAKRAEMLKIDHLEQGAEDKLPGLERILAEADVPSEQTAYLGDDLLDLAAMRRVGYPMAVANAVDEVKQAAKYVTRNAGGHGAVREAIEHLLKAHNAWDQAIEAIGAHR